MYVARTVCHMLCVLGAASGGRQGCILIALNAAKVRLLGDFQLNAAGEAGEITFVDVTQTALCSTYRICI